MIALFCLCLALFVSPFKSKSRLEAENAALRHQLVNCGGRCAAVSGSRMVIVCSSSSCIDGFHRSSRPSQLFAPRPSCDGTEPCFRRYWRWKSRPLGGRPQIDADLRALIRRMSVDNPLGGAPRAASCSSSALRSLSPASRSIWSSDTDLPRLGGAPFCVTMRPTSPPWTYSLPPPLASTCSMFLSSFNWSAENLSGSTSHAIRLRNGLHARSQRHSLGLKPHAT